MKTKNLSEISVVLPVYNAEALLKEAMETTDVDFERLLEEDAAGESDETLRTSESFRELREKGYTTIKTKG